MATIEEKEELMATLKFTPRTYNISMWGYGGEIVMGKIDRKIFDYFKHRRLSVSDFAWNYDYAEENNIPEDMWPFEPGSWYECDDFAHSNGADRESGTLQIEDENGENIVERSLEDIDGTDIELCCDNEAWITMAGPGEVVFIGRSNEKGTFFEGQIDLTTPFKPEKLCLTYDEIDGTEFIHSVTYDGDDIDNNGGCTDGKSSDFGFFLVKDDNTWERYVDHDSIEYPKTEWFPKKIDPVYVGNYIVKTAGKNSYTYQAKWTGTRWISAWQDDLPETETLKIKEWQGIPFNPDDEPEWDPAAELDKIIVEHADAIEELKRDPDAKWPF